jgi:hypothetical protein
VGIKQLDQLGEVRERPRKTVDLVDNDDVNPAAGCASGPPLVASLIVICGGAESPSGTFETCRLRRAM